MRKKNEKLWAHLHKELNDWEILAGWFENSTYDGKTPIAGIAAVQNYGANISQTVSDKQRRFLHAIGIHLKKTTENINITIPARPFMDNAKERIQGQEGKEIVLQELLRVFEGRQTMLQAVRRMKEWAKSIIQEELKAIQEPPLSPLTIKERSKAFISKAKKPNKTTSEKPLNATGLMFKEVQGKARLKRNDI